MSWESLQILIYSYNFYLDAPDSDLSWAHSALNLPIFTVPFSWQPATECSQPSLSNKRNQQGTSPVLWFDLGTLLLPHPRLAQTFGERVLVEC